MTKSDMVREVLEDRGIDTPSAEVQDVVLMSGRGKVSYQTITKVRQQMHTETKETTVNLPGNLETRSAWVDEETGQLMFFAGPENCGINLAGHWHYYIERAIQDATRETMEGAEAHALEQIWAVDELDTKAMEPLFVRGAWIGKDGKLFLSVKTKSWSRPLVVSLVRGWLDDYRYAVKEVHDKLQRNVDMTLEGIRRF